MQNTCIAFLKVRYNSRRRKQNRTNRQRKEFNVLKIFRIDNYIILIFK